MYLISREVTFSAAHSIRGHTGGCEKVHGHNYRVKIFVGSPALDAMGMVMDFKDLKAAIDRAVSTLDHGMLNEVDPFTEVNPTAENIAKFFCDTVQGAVNEAGVTVTRVEVFETETACAVYIPGS